MTTSIKFGSSEIIKFIEIYDSRECLWNTSNYNYKNRDMRNAALSFFDKELGIGEFGIKEITTKIKNIRSQYLEEIKRYGHLRELNLVPRMYIIQNFNCLILRIASSWLVLNQVLLS